MPDLRKKYGKDYYRNIGKKSWKDPGRSREVGFAAMSPELVKQLGAKGGKSTKKAEETDAVTEASEESGHGVQPMDKG